MNHYKSIAELKAKNESIGMNWFSTETMTFFNSRVEGDLHDGDFFISSEQYDDESPRQYKVRQGTKTGHIATLTEWLSSLKEAEEKIKWLQEQIKKAQPDVE